MNKERLSHLSFEEKQKLVQELRKNKLHLPGNKAITIDRYPRNKPIPTSVIQQEIWLHENLVPNSNAYNIPIAMEIHGKLNYPALVQAFQMVIQRYEILRSSFYTIQGIPHQKIEDSIDFKLNVVSLTHLSNDEKQKTSLDILFLFSKHSFNLDKAPLFRVLCMELAPESFILSFVIHHLLCDNWSLTLLIQEILDLFNQILQGEQIPFLEPKFQYADYCFWEKEMLNSEETKAKMEYLKNKLRSLNFELKLPYDHPRTFNERATAKSKQFMLDNESKQSITRLCKEKNLTPYIFFLTVYHALIYKYTFQKKIVIGTSFLNRPSDEDKMMGPFINVALIDSEISPQITFESLAHQIRKNILEMHGYRFIPLNKMIKSMNTIARKELSLTQIFFGFLNFRLNQISSASTNDLSVTLLNQSNELRVYNSAKFELDLTMWEDEENMGGSLEYMNNIFEDETIVLLIGHYKQLCRYMADHFNSSLQEAKIYNPFQNPVFASEEEPSFVFCDEFNQ